MREEEVVCWSCGFKVDISKSHDPPTPKRKPEEKYCGRCIKIKEYEMIQNQFRCPDCKTSLENIGWLGMTAYCSHCNVKWEILFGNKIQLGEKQVEKNNSI